MPEPIEPGTVFDPKVAAGKAGRSFVESLTSIGAVLAIAFAAVPPEALSAFVAGLHLQGWVAIAAVPVLLAVQRYFANKSKIEAASSK
jgi:hypothetical protein